MDKLCVRCAHRTFYKGAVASRRAQIGSRSFSLSARLLEDIEKSGDSGVSRSGVSIDQALSNRHLLSSRDQKPTSPRASETKQHTLLRKVSSPTSGILLRRSNSPSSEQDSTSRQGAPLRRSASPQSGQILRRTGAPTASRTFGRTRTPDTVGRSTSSRPGGSSLRRPGLPKQNNAQQKRPDRRRRLAPKNEGKDDEIDDKLAKEELENFITQYIDRPANPTQPLPYNPTKLTLDDLKSDWPNTPLSTSGATESIIQKIEWLARRLPHGYQSPEQIAEHYLKGNLTRFESDEEKATVLKLASELSAKTKTEAEDGTLHKHEQPRFRIVEDAAFASLASKSGDKAHLIDTGVKGTYGEAQPQKYAFIHNAERILNNNETYGPMQAQKLLARVQALIPQARARANQQTKQA